MTDRKFTHPNDAPEGHKWQTRDGREATQVTAFDVVNKAEGIVAVIEGRIATFLAEDGMYYVNRGATEWDLCDVPVARVAYVNVYPANAIGHYKTRDDANIGAGANRLACLRIEYTEGQHDD